MGMVHCYLFTSAIVIVDEFMRTLMQTKRDGDPSHPSVLFYVRSVYPILR